MLNSWWKAIACDLDGTLIGRDHKVNERDLDALRRARTAGVHVAVCTGRSSAESAGVIGALDLVGPGVFANGAMTAEMGTGKTVATQEILRELAAEVVDFFGTMGHAVLMLADDSVTRLPTYYLSNHAPPHRATQEWQLLNRTTSTVVDDLMERDVGTICRLSIVVDVPSAVPILRALEKRFAEQATWHSIYSPYFDCQVIELFAHRTTKWTGIGAMASVLGVKAEQVIAIGDDVNDIAMLQEARLSFAMGNAKPEIQKLAKRVTGAQKECGVAQVIDALLAGALD